MSGGGGRSRGRMGGWRRDVLRRSPKLCGAIFALGRRHGPQPACLGGPGVVRPHLGVPRPAKFPSRAAW
jgi:hypothetical protein